MYLELTVLPDAQATSTEVWIYRNEQTKEAVIAFRGTSNPKDMMTDAALAMSAFSVGHRSSGSRSVSFYNYYNDRHTQSQRA